MKTSPVFSIPTPSRSIPTVSAAKRPITQVSLSGPAGYKLEYLQEGDNYYLDRNYYLTGLPEDLQNLAWVVGANDDKNNTATDFITLNLLNDGTIYVAYDRARHIRARLAEQPVRGHTLPGTGQ